MSDESAPITITVTLTREEVEALDRAHRARKLAVLSGLDSARPEDLAMQTILTAAKAALP